jgi:hypothetical protein
MKADTKIVDLIYQITFGNFKIDDFISLSKLERKLFIDTIFKSRAHFLIYKLLNKYENSYERYNFYSTAKNTVNFYTHQSMIHLEESHRLNKILNDNKIKFIFLKGVHLINSYYNDLIDRPIRDIDVLVNKKDIKRIVNILMKSGYKFEYDVDESSLDYFLTNCYDIPVLIGKNGSRLEVHFSIESSSHENYCIFTKRFLKDSKKIKYGNGYARVLSEEDLILHLIYHGLKKSGPNVGIIFIADIFKVLTSKNYKDSMLIKKARIYNLTLHLKLVVELLCSKSDNIKLNDLNNKIDIRVKAKTVQSLDFLFIRNDVFDEEVKLFQLIKKLKFKKLISNFNSSSISREYNINKTQHIKILIAYFLRMIRHLKILMFFTCRIILFRSIRLQSYKIKNILKYINDF